MRANQLGCLTVLRLLVVLWCLLQPSPAGSVRAQTAAPAAEGLFTGKTISLDLKGVDIIDVLKLLSQKSGLNFVAGRNVTGRVTIFAKDVDLWEAFERIVDANDLAYERQGELVTVMTVRDYELLYGEKFRERKRQLAIPLKFAKSSQLATVLNQVKSNLGQVVVDEPSNTVILVDVPARLNAMERLVSQLDRPTETRIYSLNYAEAEKLKEKVQEFLTPGVGVFSFDARTNKVIVSDVVESIQRIDQFIKAFDEREGEVLIEAKLVKVELTDEQSMGIDWQKTFEAIQSDGRGNFRVLGDILAPGTAAGAALKYISVQGNTQVIIEALKKYGKVETISNPRIMASNNQEAKILIGTKEAFVTTTTTVPATGSTIAAPEVQFLDVGTKLFVTPNVKRDGHVQLKIRPEVSSVSSTVTDIANTRIPIVTTTEAETNVLVESGTTVIIGGLIDSKVERTQSQLPLLGDIPMLGAAFRSRKDVNKKTELVVFLTPQIVSADGAHVKEFKTEPSLEVTVEPGLPVPASYYTAVRQQLVQHLIEGFRAASLPEGSVTVSFLLEHTGYLVGRPEVTSPQGEAFVQAAKTAIESSAPFPPFPKDATATRVRFRMAVDHRPSG